MVDLTTLNSVRVVTDAQSELKEAWASPMVRLVRQDAASTLVNRPLRKVSLVRCGRACRDCRLVAFGILLGVVNEHSLTEVNAVIKSSARLLK